MRAAYDARGAWRRTAPSERAAALRAAAAAVRGARADDAAATRCAPHRAAAARGARRRRCVAAELLEEAAVTGLGVAGRTLAGAPGALDVVRAEPRGVVAVLTPWNDPFPAAAGLVGGGARHRQHGGAQAVGAQRRAGCPDGLDCVAACLPDGVLEVVSRRRGRRGAGRGGRPRRGGRARRQQRDRAGDQRRGRRQGREGAAGERGKDPIVVDAGVDPAWAAQQIAVGAFTNAGQLCTAVERVYLHADVADAVTAELVRLAAALQPGDPRDDGTTLTPDGRRAPAAGGAGARVRGRRGRRAVPTGGARLALDGSWYPATVLTGCTADMAVMTQETFGPVAPITVVRDFEEGLRLAAESEYGLAATVLTPDSVHALRAVEELDVGTVKVNAVFGGAPGGSADPRRASGNGCGYGPDLLRELVALKAVHLGTAPREAELEPDRLRTVASEAVRPGGRPRAVGREPGPSSGPVAPVHAGVGARWQRRPDAAPGMPRGDPPGVAGRGAGQLQMPGDLGRGDGGGVALLVHDRVVPRAQQRHVVRSVGPPSHQCRT